MKIFVSGFINSCNEETIKLIFKSFGEINSIKIKDKTAIVEFKSIEQANEAISILNNKQLADSSILSLSLYYNKNKRLIIQNEYNLNDLKSILSKYGPIYNITTTPTHILIDFYNRNDVERILQEKIYLKNKILNFSRSINYKVPDNQTIFIYNLSNNIKKEDLVKIFKKYGDIISCGINENRGYINYNKSISAMKAFRHLDGKKLKNKKIRLKLKAVS